MEAPPSVVLLALKNRGVVSLDWYGGLGGGCWGGQEAGAGSHLWLQVDLAV